MKQKRLHWMIAIYSIIWLATLVLVKPLYAFAMDPTASGTEYFNSNYYYIYADGPGPKKSDAGEYNYGSDTAHSPYYVIEKRTATYPDGSTLKGFSKQIIYCVDSTRDAPGTATSPFNPDGSPKYNFDIFLGNPSNNLWVKVSDNASDGNINDVTSNNDAKTGYYIRRALYNGYPYNGSGLKEKYNLTDMQFRAVTQAAVWTLGTTNASITYDWQLLYNKAKDSLTSQYFNDFNNTADGLDQRMATVFYTLIQNPKYANYPPVETLTEPPASISLSLYEHAGNTSSKYQRLVAINGPSAYNVKVTKKWADGNSSHDPVTVTLKLNGKTYKTAQLSAENNWTFTFEDLLEYDITFKKVSYTVEESTPAGYSSSVSGSQDTGFTITNTPSEQPKIKISKKAVSGSSELAGAKLKLINASGATVAEWTSGTTPYEVQLVPGTYTFHEEAAPSGYLTVSDFTFTVAANGTISNLSSSSHAAASGTTLTVTDDAAPTITISKVAATGHSELEGAKLSLLDANGKTVDSWTSGTEAHQVQVAPGTYTFHEEAAPKGYLVVSNFTFTVAADGTISNISASSGVKASGSKLVVTDLAAPTITISKVAVTGSGELEGASLSLLDKDGKTIDSWTSGTTAHKVQVAPGTYTFHEEAAPNGYLVATDFTFDVDAQGNISNLSSTSNAAASGAKLTVTDAAAPTIAISKVAATGSSELEGASLSLLDKDGKTIDSWISGTEAHKVQVVPGTYTFHEEAAPKGYLVVSDFTFDVDGQGNITNLSSSASAKTEGTKLTVTDSAEPTITISKVAATGSGELEGAKLELRDASNNVVDSWTSSTEAHSVQVAPGTYTFHEEAAPKGYLVVSDFTFDVDAQGNISNLSSTANVAADGAKLTVTDAAEPTITISKVAATGSGELEGASLSLLDKDGKTVDSWTSGSDAHSVQVAPGTYTFHEEAAPKGYLVVSDFTFDVDANGNISNLSSSANAQSEGAKLTVTDAAEPTITISKVAATGSGELEGAKLSLLDKDGKTVDSWTSGSEAHQVQVAPGTYTFHEEAAPKGYLVVSNFTFDVDANGNISNLSSSSNVAADGAKLTVTDAAEPTITISKVAATGSGELEGASLSLLDKDGKTVDSWTSGSEAHQVQVAPGTYTFHEEAAPSGYLVVSDFTFNVDENGTITNLSTSQNVVAEGAVLTVTDDAKPTGEVPPTNPPTTPPTQTKEKPKSVLPKTSDLGLGTTAAFISLAALSVFALRKRLS